MRIRSEDVMPSPLLVCISVTSAEPDAKWARRIEAHLKEADFKIIDLAQADELILAAHLYDHKARLKSFEIAANVRNRVQTNFAGLVAARNSD